jgi:hypothetical protein
MNCKNSLIWACLLLWFLLTYDSVSVAQQVKDFMPEAKYEAHLNINEFSMLNSSMADGITKYGGVIDVSLKMSRANDEIEWVLSCNNSIILEVLGQYVAEKSIEILKAVDPDNLSANVKNTLKVIKTLSGKIEYSLKNPIWESKTVKGLLSNFGDELYLQNDTLKLLLTGTQLSRVYALRGKEIIATGYIKAKNQFEITKSIEKRDNVLEIFGMSLCPFAQRAEGLILANFDKLSINERPKLEVHFILYKKIEAEKTMYYSLHGETELIEDLVQILIRDNYPDYFIRYLLTRLKDSSLTWTDVALQADLHKNDIENIKNMLNSQRDNLLDKEYNYATLTYEIFDKSPSYVWEGEKVKNLSEIPFLKNLNGTPTEECSK